MHQTTSACDIFRYIFFLGALRAKVANCPNLHAIYPPVGVNGWMEAKMDTWPIAISLEPCQLQGKKITKISDIGVAPIMQLRMCVIKQVTFKGGHPM